uniref:Uncharacterized protein n=1 Tax=Candidatus Kentrum sp. DK TaxID=2126562 RepID=A0A450T1J3_9GAMM|nr:MAG: hypothetical protein BECKDK2373C_GA0170839_108017 [Candidatus Kentron sp. DK]
MGNRQNKMPPRGKRAASCERLSQRRPFLMHRYENSETLFFRYVKIAPWGKSEAFGAIGYP